MARFPVGARGGNGKIDQQAVHHALAAFLVAFQRGVVAAGDVQQGAQHQDFGTQQVGIHAVAQIGHLAVEQQVFDIDCLVGFAQHHGHIGQLHAIA
jgi:hypothetical protein